jgi:hypothetical protein
MVEHMCGKESRLSQASSRTDLGASCPLLLRDGFPKSGLELHMPAQDPMDGASAAMAHALEQYQHWLIRGWSSASPGGVSPSGTGLLVAITQLSRQLYPEVSPLVGELLVVHAQLTTMIYELQLRAIRAGQPVRTPIGPEASACVEKQIATIGRMRAACCQAAPPALSCNTDGTSDARD